MPQLGFERATSGAFLDTPLWAWAAGTLAATTTAAGAYYLFSRRTRTLSKRACHKAKDEAPIITSWGKEQGHTTLITEDS